MRDSLCATPSAPRSAVWVFSFGVACIISFCTYVGLLMYTYFRDCDPLAAGVRKKDTSAAQCTTWCHGA